MTLFMKSQMIVLLNVLISESLNGLWSWGRFSRHVQHPVPENQRAGECMW